MADQVHCDALGPCFGTCRGVHDLIWQNTDSILRSYAKTYPGVDGSVSINHRFLSGLRRWLLDRRLASEQSVGAVVRWYHVDATIDFAGIGEDELAYWRR